MPARAKPASQPAERLAVIGTALVLIDLQQGIATRDSEPRSVTQVVEDAKRLAGRFRKVGSLVVNVRVTWHDDLGDTPSMNVDEPMQLPEDGLPEGFDVFIEGVMEPGDVEIVKRQWGAFRGTELDLQLRRRGIRTLVIGGIATNFGVESTVRDAWEHGNDVVVAEDLCASVSAALHDTAIRSIFPRISRVSTTGAIDFDARG